MKAFYWFACTFYRGYFRLFHRHRVYGLENIPPGAAIIAPNHTSFWDPPVIGISFPEEVHFLAKAKLFEHNGLSWLIRHLNAHPIQGTTTQDLSSIRMILHLLKENKKVVVFPEGIRSYDGKLASIKSGIGMLALRAKVPIIPVYIYGTYEIWPRNNKFPKPWRKTACIIGKPIDGIEHALEDRKEAQQAIAEAVAKSIHSLRHWFLEGAIGTPS